MGSSSSSRAPAASRSNAKKQQGECAGGRKANDEVVCETFTGTDNEYDSSVEVVTSFEILAKDESDSLSDESGSESDESSSESSSESDEVGVYEDERARVLAEAIALKKAALDYAHPEVKITTFDPSVYGRNYFNRISAPEVEEEDIEELAQILADVRALKKSAVDHGHPEIGVVTSDPTVYGRNYFDRMSAPEVEDEDIEERAAILADAIALKKAAVDYGHPEVEVITSDPSVYGRNYFNRHGTDHPGVSTVSTKEPSNVRKERAMSNVSETFEFDDDIFNHMREEFRGMEDSNLKKFHTLRHEESHPEDESSNPEDEGKLSRSPSSVMLFGLADGAAY